MGLGISILGSGSRGNAILLHGEDGCVMVDAGFSRKELVSRMETVGARPESVRAILITHEHSDHVSGCRLFSEEYSVPVYLTEDTFRYLNERGKISGMRQRFSPGTSFSVGGFTVSPFSVNHDALDPVGFTLSAAGMKIGIATDIGQINTLAENRLKGCDALVLECNHDIDMLRNSQRPMSLKRRILGRHGHLNNHDAMDALERLVSENTRCVFLAHISSDCNDHELVKNMAMEKLNKMKRTDILLKVALQDSPLETIWL